MMKSVSNVSFSARTKNGNEYKKTNVGKMVGLVVGVTTAVRTVEKLMPPKIDTHVKTFIAQEPRNFLTRLKAAFSKLNKGHMKMIGITTAVALGAGAVIDAFINNSRKTKIDKI